MKEILKGSCLPNWGSLCEITIYSFFQRIKAFYTLISVSDILMMCCLSQKTWITIVEDYDKRFSCVINNLHFLFICGNIPAAPAGVTSCTVLMSCFCGMWNYFLDTERILTDIIHKIEMLLKVKSHCFRSLSNSPTRNNCLTVMNIGVGQILGWIKTVGSTFNSCRIKHWRSNLCQNKTVEVNTVGIKSVGAIPVGIKSVGMKSVGMKSVGVIPVGI